jgi:V/A-type H+-transporting ATPase subunit E
MSTIKSGLAAIAAEILKDVQEEAEGTLSESEKEAKEILKTAKKEADHIYSNAIHGATSKASNERLKIQSLTEVEKRNRLLQTKEELVDLAFERAMKKIQDFTKTDEYHNLLIELIKRGTDKLPSGKILLKVNAADKKWLLEGNLKKISKGLKSDLELDPTTGDFTGGCALQTEDQKVQFDNTFENRLKHLRPTLRIQIAKILFETEE